MRVLVADDQPAVLEAARLLLKSNGHAALTADSPQAALRIAESQPVDLILMDLNYARDTTSGQEGLDLLNGLRAAGVDAPIVVMTAWGTVDVAVEAMRRGACDFVQKPWDNARLIETIQKQVERSRATRSDIDIARGVQQKLLPHAGPQLATLDYAGRCVPARGVGGDYYDWFDLGPGDLGFLLADVSGKGMGAAMLMAHLHAAFRSRMSAGFPDLCTLVEGVNRQFWESSPPEQFATLVFARYNDRTRRLRYVNAGHVAPLLLRASGEVQRLDSTAMVVGVLPSWTSQEVTVDLAPGDNLVLYSDGVVEAGIETREEFGEERLIKLMRTLREVTIDRAAAEICTRVTAYAPDLHDDTTVLALRCR
jgi:sigma-B regulation protein RsbU (phosphoserine phosphatase)